MKTARLVIGVLLLVVLSGCIRALIPDQSAQDLYGFNNFNVDLTLSQEPALRADQTGTVTVASGSVSREVTATDIAELPLDPTGLQESVRPRSVRLFVAQPSLKRQAITDDLPQSIALTFVTFDVNFTDGQTTVSKTFEATFEPNAVLQRDDASCTTTRCDYLPTGDAVASLTVAITAQDAAGAIAVLLSDLNPKVARGDSRIGLADDPLFANVASARMTIETFDGVISFK